MRNIRCNVGTIAPRATPKFPRPDAELAMVSGAMDDDPGADAQDPGCHVAKSQVEEHQVVRREHMGSEVSQTPEPATNIMLALAALFIWRMAL